MQILPKLMAVAGVVILSGCTSKIAEPEKYSGFLQDYSGLTEAASPSGRPELRWVSPQYDPKNYDSIVFTPVTYFPQPSATSEANAQMLETIRAYTETQLKAALAAHKTLATSPDAHCLIFRGAITHVDTNKEGLQFYEVLPVGLLIAGAEAASGHRTMNTHLYFEAELIDATTQQPVMKVVRKAEGKTLSNESKPVTLEALKEAIDAMASDAADIRSAS
ncbi:DUF3313 domain-containing protein [Rahnella sp. PD12R]|uniref:DUF3313 domain-containing protein n=1 Tax=Rahnella sp. PD12R TaxID=2855688 RepID=UPI001C43E28D|nr:DUF3313 domain-containing protein [Rahnella sp. PD12R]MBV6819319.1 DUF3313 domain-containing protein [Rahnella sp. PD12R]